MDGTIFIVLVTFMSAKPVAISAFDCRDNFSRHKDALEKMVLDDFLDGSAQE
jgi:hypothetical protein